MCIDFKIMFYFSEIFFLIVYFVQKLSQDHLEIRYYMYMLLWKIIFSITVILLYYILLSYNRFPKAMIYYWFQIEIKSYFMYRLLIVKLARLKFFTSITIVLSKEILSENRMDGVWTFIIYILLAFYKTELICTFYIKLLTAVLEFQ